MMKSTFPATRMRRLRGHAAIRDLIAETQLSVKDLVLPLFIHHGIGVKNPVSTMPGHYQLSIDNLKDEIKEITDLGISSVLLFGIPAQKDSMASDSCQDDGIIQTAIQAIKEMAPQLLVMTDVCCCEYTDHGHCGIINDRTGKMDVDNDATLAILAKQAVSHAKAGADMVAPSGMIDGMVYTIRMALDQAGFEYIPILSYAAKYASSLN